MLIGVVVLIPAAPPSVIVFFWAIISFLSLLNDNPQFLSLVLKPNIMVLPMLSLKLAGFVIFFLNYGVLSQQLLWSIVIMLVLFIYQATLFTINALNILRWTFILFVKKSNVVMFEFIMFHLDIRLLIFLPRVSLKFFLMIFAPVSASANLPIRLRGCVRI